VRTFFEAARAVRGRGVVLLMMADGSELCRFDADNIVTVDRLRLSQVPKGLIAEIVAPQDDVDVLSIESGAS
jgi:hypothetical protein